MSSCSEQHTICFVTCFFSFILLDRREPFFKIVCLWYIIITVRSIHPYFHKMSLISVFRVAQDFLKLVVIIFIVGIVDRSTIRTKCRFCYIPWWKIQSHVHISCRTCFWNFCKDVSFSIFITCTCNVIICIRTVPDTESIMMLCCYNQLFKSCIFQCGY